MYSQRLLKSIVNVTLTIQEPNGSRSQKVVTGICLEDEIEKFISIPYFIGVIDVSITYESKVFQGSVIDMSKLWNWIKICTEEESLDEIHFTFQKFDKVTEMFKFNSPTRYICDSQQLVINKFGTTNDINEKLTNICRFGTDGINFTPGSPIVIDEDKRKQPKIVGFVGKVKFVGTELQTIVVPIQNLMHRDINISMNYVLDDIFTNKVLEKQLRVTKKYGNLSKNSIVKKINGTVINMDGTINGPFNMKMSINMFLMYLSPYNSISFELESNCSVNENLANFAAPITNRVYFDPRKFNSELRNIPFSSDLADLMDKCSIDSDEVLEFRDDPRTYIESVPNYF